MLVTGSFLFDQHIGCIVLAMLDPSPYKRASKRRLLLLLLLVFYLCLLLFVRRVSV